MEKITAGPPYELPVPPLLWPPVMKAFQDYTEPEDVSQASPQRRAVPGADGDDVVLPLGENTLTHNLGIPVLVVCSKVRGGEPFQYSAFTPTIYLDF